MTFVCSVTVLTDDGKFYPISAGVPYVREEVIRAKVEKLLNEDTVPFQTYLNNQIKFDNAMQLSVSDEP